MAAALQAAINTAQSVRLKQALQLAPRFLSVYFEIALQDASDCMLPFLICFINILQSSLLSYYSLLLYLNEAL